jgi:hypothetical protein
MRVDWINVVWKFSSSGKWRMMVQPINIVISDASLTQIWWTTLWPLYYTSDAPQSSITWTERSSAGWVSYGETCPPGSNFMIWDGYLHFPRFILGFNDKSFSGRQRAPRQRGAYSCMVCMRSFVWVSVCLCIWVSMSILGLATKSPSYFLTASVFSSFHIVRMQAKINKYP